MKFIVTGGAGFIGSHLIDLLLENPENEILNIDKLTYAANLELLKKFEKNTNYSFKKEDIIQFEVMKKTINSFRPNVIFHLAAESHVDRSISDPLDFIKTNVLGTGAIIEAANQYWKKLDDSKRKNFRFHHISTDEVFGSLLENDYFTEETKYDPSSPYSASKAGSDHLVRAWHRTYGLPVIITNCSNNFGPYQNPEKLIPKIIMNAINKKPIPIYGDGMQERDWLYVEDHAEALYKVMKNGEVGETYNIGADNQKTNIDIAKLICSILDEKIQGSNFGLKSFSDLITYVKDRPGHDQRYAIDASKIKNNLKWQPKYDFKHSLKLTIEWYIQNYG